MHEKHGMNFKCRTSCFCGSLQWPFSDFILFLGGINLQATEEAGLAGPLQYYLTRMQQLDNLNGKLTLEQCDPIILDPKTAGYNFLDTIFEREFERGFCVTWVT